MTTEPEAGSELDARIAEEVMGCRQTPDDVWHGPSGWTFRTDTPALATNWSPSTEIAAAWKVVERMWELGHQLELRTYGPLRSGEGVCVAARFLKSPPRDWCLELYWKPPPFGVDETISAPLAICRAALETVEKGESNECR